MLNEGMVFKTNSFGELLITEYVNYKEVYVKFTETGYETKTTMASIKKGQVKDKLLPSVYGVGVVGDEVTKIEGKHVKEYMLWCKMLQRCYDKKFHEKSSTYKDCTVSDNFKYFPYFKEWCNQQIGFNSSDDKDKPFQLDKDLLIKGNRQYNENVCVFVPQEINTLLIKCDSTRGDLYIGVYFKHKDNKYVSQLRKGGNQTTLGAFTTEIEAFYTYKQAKESHIKDVANKWKEAIDVKAYNTLMEYSIEITD